MSASNEYEPIPFSAPDIREEDIAAVSAVLRSGWITTGSECEQFEAELATYLGGDVHVVAVASCTAALEIAAAYHGLRAGHRVGVPTWTFASTALSVMRQGATPVLLDVEPDTLNVDYGSLERALDEGLDAVVLVHMGGVPVQPDIHELCDDRGVHVIEDAAHALGATDCRGRVGSSGAATCFSFYATKNLTSGEGGALATTNASLADFGRSFRLHGLSADAYNRYVPGRPADYELIAGGIKANYPDVLAALARTQLRRFDVSQEWRRDLVGRYRKQLTAIPEVDVIPKEPVDGSADHLLLVTLSPGVNREALRTALASDQIGSSVHFQPLHTFTWLQQRADVAPGGLTAADAMRARVLSLPLHGCLRNTDVDRVCSSLSRHLDAYG